MHQNIRIFQKEKHLFLFYSDITLDLDTKAKKFQHTLEYFKNTFKKEFPVIFLLLKAIFVTIFFIKKNVIDTLEIK